MKKIIITVSLLMGLLIHGMAQNTVTIAGQTNPPVSGKTVWINFTSNSTGCNFSATATTNSNGAYMHTFNLGTCNYGFINAYMLDCFADTIGGFSSYDTTRRTDSVYIDFKTCDSCKNFKAGFNVTTSGSNASFSNTTTLVATSYLWRFGDGDSSVAANPTHTYTSSGTFNACLYAKKGNCISVACKQLYFGGSTPSGSLQGVILRDTTQTSFADTGRVWLIIAELDSSRTDTVLTAIDSVDFTNNGYYRFSNVAPGYYMIKAALLPSSAYYSSRMPTYYVQSASWTGATFTGVYVNSTSTANIVLIAGTNPGGSGFIGGLVSQGANKTGDPLAALEVQLYTSAGVPVAFTHTDINGEYKFNNIAFGSYKVRVEIPGKKSEEFLTTIDANTPSVNKGNFDVNSNGIVVKKSSTGIADITTSNLAVYPNPATNHLYLTFMAAQHETAQVTLTDITGKTIISKTIQAAQGQNTVELDVNTTGVGLYLITVSTGNTAYTGRISIVK